MEKCLETCLINYKSKFFDISRIYILPFFSEFNLNESIIMREKAHTNVINFYCVFKGYTCS